MVVIDGRLPVPSRVIRLKPMGPNLGDARRSRRTCPRRDVVQAIRIHHTYSRWRCRAGPWPSRQLLFAAAGHPYGHRAHLPRQEQEYGIIGFPGTGTVFCRPQELRRIQDGASLDRFDRGCLPRSRFGLSPGTVLAREVPVPGGVMRTRGEMACQFSPFTKQRLGSFNNLPWRLVPQVNVLLQPFR